MSERITWTKCPICGAPMAVGWVVTAWQNGEPVEEVPAELDCSAGCAVDLQKLRRSLDESD